MTIPNPFALAANTIRQIGESANQTVQSVGNQFAQVTSQGLRAVASGGPPLPLPGVAGGIPLPFATGNPNGGGNSNGNPNGNPNGNQTGPLGLPSLQQVLPIQAIQAVGQLENSILPAGIPRVSQLLLSVAGAVNGNGNGNGNGGTSPEPAPSALPAPSRSPGTEGLDGVSQRGRARGVQLV